MTQHNDELRLHHMRDHGREVLEWSILRHDLPALVAQLDAILGAASE